ncbi:UROPORPHYRINOGEN III SYNTHASE [Ceraceosorus bombacis]|uniref:UROPORPHYRINOGEN III SYNTHASE n=1 Tax=Ceraceosorus bombacis TaxID=401625 RepID=A0A0P1BAL8_9BASI|nr:UROPORPHYRINOGEN III SYNTHASE [Ceraceosorus bombacis]
MTTPEAAIGTQARPTTVLLLRTPVPPSVGTDPYHDIFGPFCLPSFPFSALESGSSTPLPAAPLNPHSIGKGEGVELLKNALQGSETGRRRGRWISDDDSLTTTHLEKVNVRATRNGTAAGAAADGEDEETLEREWCVCSIPVLGHSLIDTDGLTRRVDGDAQQSSQLGAHEKYRGVIVTSQRAVDAWAEAAKQVAQEMQQGKHAPTTTWNRVPFFAVGPATASALRQLAPSLPLPLRPSLVMGGGATGTGEALANYVIRHFGGDPFAPPAPNRSEVEVTSQPPILVLVGDKNAPTIPDKLRGAALNYEVQQVYETCLDDDFEERCTDLARTLPATSSRPGSRRPSRSNSGSFGGGGRRPSWAASIREAADQNAAHLREGIASALGSIASVGSNPLSAMTPVSHAHTQAGGTGSPLQAANAIADEEDDALPDAPLPLDTDLGLGTGRGTKPDWIVLFSPSGLTYALSALRRKKWIPPASNATTNENGGGGTSSGAPEGYPRIACLGPTTKRAVKETLGFQADAVASAPEPIELKEAIKNAEIRIRREREKFKEARMAQEAQRRERRDNPDPDGLIEMDTS